MNVLPVIERELRVGARNRRTWSTRIWSGLAAFGLTLYMIWLAWAGMAGRTTGVFILKFTAYAALATATFGALGRTSDAISSEKRQDTLGLLFLTHLKGPDIVLGKLFIGALESLYQLVAIVPILSIPVMLGGVSGTELLRIPVALLNSLFLSLSIGLLISAILVQQRAAFSTSSVLMLFLSGGLPLLAFSLQRKGLWLEVVPVLQVFSPVFSIDMAFGSSVGLSNNRFWTAAAVQFCLGSAVLALTCLILPHTWKLRSPGAVYLKWRERMAQWYFGSASQRARLRRKPLNRNPFLWLLCRDRFGPFHPLLLGAIIYGAFLWPIFYYDLPAEPSYLILLMAAAINDLAARVRVASLSAYRLAQDRQIGALEMILSTPLTVKEILRGHWRAIARTMLPGYLVLAAAFWILNNHYRDQWDDGTPLILFFFVVISVGDLLTISCVGMWKAMRVNNPLHAPGAALARVLVAPWFFWFISMPVFNAIPGMWSWFESWEPYSWFTGAFVYWLVSSLLAWVLASRHLRLHFREAATDRYNFEKRWGWFRDSGSKQLSRGPAWIFSRRRSPSVLT